MGMSHVPHKDMVKSCLCNERGVPAVVHKLAC